MQKDFPLVPWPARRLSHDVVLMGLVYAALAFLAIAALRRPGTIATLWWANAAATAIIVSAPAGRTLPLLAAAAAGNLLANLGSGDPLGLALAFVFPNTVEVALASLLVRRYADAERFADEQGALVRLLVAGAFLPPLLGACLGAATLQILGFAPFTAVWADWYIGAALCSVVTLPLVVTLRLLGWRASLRRFTDPWKLLSMAMTGLTTALALHWLPYPFVVMGVMLLVFAFLRPCLTTFANAFVLVAVLAVSMALTDFQPARPSATLDHLVAYISTLLAVVPAQIVAVAVARQRTLSDLLSAVGSQMDEIVVFADMMGIVRWINEAREQYWGIARADMLGKHWAENMPEAAYREVAKPMFDQARNGQTVRRTVAFDYPVRGLRTIDMSMQPARDEEGHQIGVLSCGRDITDLEASRQAFQQSADRLANANRSLEQFVRIASHDMREPLNTIVQFGHLINLTKAGQLDADGQLYLKQVTHGAARMKTMLDDVLQFVRLEGEADHQNVQVDLDALAADVTAALAAQLQARKARVEVAPLGSVWGHPALLALVLQNFISNAVKFVPPQQTPWVRVRVERSECELRLVVQDNGIGIEAHRLEELGQPFRRLHARRMFEGTGLGLAICKRIAEQHGGGIDITSTVGEGSVVALRLPLAAALPPPDQGTRAVA